MQAGSILSRALQGFTWGSLQYYILESTNLLHLAIFEMYYYLDAQSSDLFNGVSRVLLVRLSTKLMAMWYLTASPVILRSFSLLFVVYPVLEMALQWLGKFGAFHYIAFRGFYNAMNLRYLESIQGAYRVNFFLLKIFITLSHLLVLPLQSLDISKLTFAASVLMALVGVLVNYEWGAIKWLTPRTTIGMTLKVLSLLTLGGYNAGLIGLFGTLLTGGTIILTGYLIAGEQRGDKFLTPRDFWEYMMRFTVGFPSAIIALLLNWFSGDPTMLRPWRLLLLSSVVTLGLLLRYVIFSDTLWSISVHLGATFAWALIIHLGVTCRYQKVYESYMGSQGRSFLLVGFLEKAIGAPFALLSMSLSIRGIGVLLVSILLGNYCHSLLVPRATYIGQFLLVLSDSLSYGCMYMVTRALLPTGHQSFNLSSTPLVGSLLVTCYQNWK